MFSTLKRKFVAWRGFDQPQAKDTVASRSPLVNLGRVIRTAHPLIEEQLRSLRAQQELVDTLDDHLARAWKEREDYVRDYYELLRGVIRALEEDEGPQDPIDRLSAARDRLGQVLKEQGVSSFEVKTGDRFCSETQCSVDVERSGEASPGTVLRLLETGYRRTLADGESVVVRPAQVVVSGHLPETEEFR